MCGFIGFTGVGREREGILKKMLLSIEHRGPDSQDTYLDETVALGFARLSIIDLATGSQPLFNEDKTLVLVFNGEIYNYKTIRAELLAKGHVFTTKSDSEVLIHGYEEYGPDLLPKLRGMFSFVLWDTRKKKIFAARDFFGIKPLYYAKMAGRLFFGSEIKGFLPHPDFKKELFEEKLVDYLAWSCVPLYDTFFKNVYKLPPGHYLEYENGTLQITRYFTPEFHIDNETTMDSFVGTIASEVTKSVTAHTVSDVEVGCFLSSGVDSSYVAKELVKMGKVKTFTVGFNDARYDESADVTEFAKEIGVSNKAKMVTSEEYFKNVGNVQYHLDEPLANPSANLLYFVSELAAEEVKVVLSGEGADEMFGGYNVYKEPVMTESYHKVPIFVRKAIAALVRPIPDFKGRNFLIRGSQSVEDWYIGNGAIFKDKERAKFLKKPSAGVSPQTYTKPFYEKVKGHDDVTKMQYVDIHLWMVQEILLKADKMSMAHSLELRVPFLDKEIFSVANPIPLKYKVSKENTKLAFRKAASGEMSLKNADRRKMAFPLPLPEWLKEDRYQALVKKYFTSPAAEQFFVVPEIVSLLKDHASGKKNNSRKIWAVFTFLVWHEEFFLKR